jgi:hypothetical protein
MSGSHHQWSSCNCFVCGDDGSLYTNERQDFWIVLCRSHFVSVSEQYILVSNGGGTLLVGFVIDELVPPGGEEFLDLSLFSKLIIEQDVSGDDEWLQ